MNEATQCALSSNKNKRGVVRASVTRLHTRVGELEGSGEDTDTTDQARRLTTLLQTLVEEFKVHHYAVIDVIEEEGDLAKEQDILDKFDDNVAQLLARLEKLSSKEPSAGSSLSKSTTKQLKHLQVRKLLRSRSTSTASPAPDVKSSQSSSPD